MDATHALPDRVLSWARAHAPAPVTDVTRIGNGITDTKRLLVLARGEPLVIRWADPDNWGETGREHVRREAWALRELAGSTVPVPRLLATADQLAGGAANLMSWLPGSVRHDPLGPQAITELARLAVAVHSHPVGSARPPVYAVRGPRPPEVPGWARSAASWQRAVDLVGSTAPPTPFGLLHRDFHLGNVLWSGDRITGLIDWAETSWGPADLDVAHLCADFAMLHSPAAAEAFRTEYRRQGGRLAVDPAAARYWVLEDVMGFLPDPAHILPAVAGTRPELGADDVRHGLEDLVLLALGWGGPRPADQSGSGPVGGSSPC